MYILAVNRRLDEWVKLDQLDLDSVEAVVDEKVEEKVMVIPSNGLLAFILDFLYYFSNGIENFSQVLEYFFYGALKLNMDK